MQSCSPSPAFLQEISHIHVPHGHQRTWFAPQLQQSVSHASLVLLCMSSRRRTWEKTWCVWKQMTDRNAEKLPATKTSAVMTAVWLSVPWGRMDLSCGRWGIFLPLSVLLLWLQCSDRLNMMGLRGYLRVYLGAMAVCAFSQAEK